MEESQLFSVFKRIRNLPSAEKVNIIIGEASYPVNKSYAAALSPYFYEKLKNNPSLNQITLNNIKDGKNFQQFLNNEKIETSFLLKIGIALGNKEIIEIWKKQEGPLNKMNCIKRLVQIISNSGSNVIPNEYLGNLNKNNQTPLHYAAENDSIKIGQLLISKGAYINAKDIIYQITKLL